METRQKCVANGRLTGSDVITKLENKKRRSSVDESQRSQSWKGKKKTKQKK